MSHTRITTLTFILSDLFPLDGFRCNFRARTKLENRLEYFDDTLQLWRAGHDDVLRTRMTTLIFILSGLFSLDGYKEGSL